MKAQTELLICVLRPDHTTLWLSEEVATALRVSRGDILTTEQFAGKRIQGLIQDRLSAEGPTKQRKQNANR